MARSTALREALQNWLQQNQSLVGVNGPLAFAYASEETQGKLTAVGDLLGALAKGETPSHAVVQKADLKEFPLNLMRAGVEDAVNKKTYMPREMGERLLKAVDDYQRNIAPQLARSLNAGLGHAT